MQINYQLRHFILITLVALLSVPAIVHGTSDPDIIPLILGRSVERELNGGEAHSFSLDLQAGQFLDLVVEQKGMDGVVALFDAENKKLVEVDDNGAQGVEPLYLILNVTGIYHLEIRSKEKAAFVGRYEAKIVALRVATETDKNKVAAQKAIEEGDVLQSQEKAESLAAAIEKYKEAFTFYQSGGDKSDEAFALYNIGLTYSKLGENIQSMENLNAALSLSRTVGDKEIESSALLQIGHVYSRLNDWNFALKFYNDSLSLFRVIGKKGSECSALNEIGSVYLQLGDYERALKLFNQALPVTRELKDEHKEATTLNNIATAYQRLGEEIKALKIFDETLTLFRRVNDKRGETTILNNVGSVYKQLGKNERALEFFDKSLLLSRLGGNKRIEAASLSNIGSVHQALGDRKRAIQFYIDALTLFHAVGEKVGEAKCFHFISICLAPDHPRFSVFISKQSVKDFEALRSNVRSVDKNVQKTFLKSIGIAYRGLAETLIKQGRFMEAHQVLNLFKDQQFFDFRQKGSSASLTLTVRESQFEALLNQKLDNLVATIRALDAAKRAIRKRHPIAAEAAQLKALEDKQKKANDDYLAFLKTAEKEFASSLDEKDTVPEIDDLGTMQDALRETSASTGQDSIAVYTLVGEENFRALVVTADDIFTVSTPVKENDLNKKASEFWSLLRTPKYDPQPLANELYKIVFKPIEEKLPRGTKTILWSLDGNLRYIPMAALHDGRRYLAERFENVIFTRADKERMTRGVSVALSGSGMGSSEAHTVDLLGDKFNAAALPAVKDEIDRIFQSGDDNIGVLAGGVLLDSRFTKKAALAELKIHRPLVHIASHFRFEPGDEARSFLLLGDGTPWTLDEMKKETDLFAGVDLLTLSACETAAQRPDANGREVDGFAELAQRLGAGAVMASLWEVADNSTSELMARFYKNYRGARPVNKAEALRRAQLMLLKGMYNEPPTAVDRQLTQTISDSIKVDAAKLKPFRASRRAPFAHPYYWSPFILIGNWK